MCLAVVALDAHPEYALVLAANRDEFHDRAAAPAAWWPEGWIAGRDLAAGGTWLGIHPRGTWALLTNVREPERRDPNAPTRGTLVTRMLASSAPLATLTAIAMETGAYNGFNLLAGRLADAAWLSNRGGGPFGLARGRVHAISNAALDTPWPKVVRTRDAVAAWCSERERDPAPLFNALASRTIAPDSELPDTGVELARERMLSAAFIVDERYGTRCSTVIMVGQDGRGRFLERSFDRHGERTGDVEIAFELQP